MSPAVKIVACAVGKPIWLFVKGTSFGNYDNYWLRSLHHAQLWAFFF